MTAGAELELSSETTTPVLGCPDCPWTWEAQPGVDMEHVCGEGDVAFCLSCGWAKEFTGHERPGYAAAMVELHRYSPGHDPVV